MLADAYVAYTFEGVPITLTLDVAPAGFVLFSREPHYPVTTSAIASYTTDWFEIGVGGGALVGNEGPCVTDVPFPREGEPVPVASSGVPVCEANTGGTVNQMLRLGAFDGLRLVWHSSIFVRPNEFVFGVGRAELAVPVSSRLGLFGAGGGGENGWGFGELGVRTFFGGTGGPGTIVMSASLGVVGIFDGPSREDVIGPSVAFGMEWRM